MSNVRIGIDPTDMHKVEFASMEEASKFIHLLDNFPNSPLINERPDMDRMKQLVEEKRLRDQDSYEFEIKTGKYKEPHWWQS